MWPRQRVPSRRKSRGTPSGRLASRSPEPHVPTSARCSRQSAWALVRDRGVRAPQPRPPLCLLLQVPRSAAQSPHNGALGSCGGSYPAADFRKVSGAVAA